MKSLRRTAKSIVKHPRASLDNALTRISYCSTGIGLPLRKNESRLLKLRNSAQGKRIFILGNGPSLLHTDVDKLRDEITIASNGIFLLFDKKKFRPTFYTIEDQLVAEDRAIEAIVLSESLKIFPRDLRQWLLPTENTLYMNFRRDYLEFPPDGPDDGNDLPKFSENFAKEVFFGGTVTYVNLQLAYFLGSSAVYLIGFDHNYAKPKNEDHVSGSVITSSTDDVNHFDPAYFGAGYRWHDPRVNRMERAYNVAKQYFQQRGGAIFNATSGGRLEIFPRINYDSLF